MPYDPLDGLVVGSGWWTLAMLIVVPAFVVAGLAYLILRLLRRL